MRVAATGSFAVRAAAVAAMAAAMIMTQVQRHDVRRERAFSQAGVTAETLYLPPTPVLEAASLGHRHFLADVLLQRGYAYFLSHLFGDRIFRWMDLYLEAILALDPDNPRVYRFASQSALYGQEITNAAILKSNSYAERGIERFPDEWRLWSGVAFNLYFEYHYKDDAEKEAMRRKARDYFTVASDIPGSDINPNFLTELYVRSNDRKMALAKALQHYYDASPREREQLRARLQLLQEEDAAKDLEVEEKRWKSDFPFVSPTFFLFVGPRLSMRLPREDAGAVENEPTEQDGSEEMP